MFQISLYNLPENETYVKIEDEYREWFFRNLRCILSFPQLAKTLNISRGVIHHWFNGNQSIPLWALKKMYLIINIEKFDLYMIQTHLTELKTGRTSHKKVSVSKPIKNPKLPIELTPALAKVIANLICDGGIKTKSRRAFYSNKNLDLIREFKKNINRAFGEIEFLQYKNPGGITIVEASSVIGMILTKFFGSFLSKKAKIPKQIFNAPEGIKADFLQGVFDDEGHVSKGNYFIELNMANKEVVEGAKKLLEDLDIYPNPIKVKTNKWGTEMYKLSITGHKNLENFLNNVGFISKKKRERLKNKIDNYKIIAHRNGEVKLKILEAIKKKGSLTVNELAKETGLTPLNLYTNHIFKLVKRNELKKVGRKRVNKNFQYLWGLSSFKKNYKSARELILDALSKEPLTAKELSNTLSLSMGNIRLRHLTELKKIEIIESIGRRNGSILWRTTNGTTDITKHF